MDIVVLFEEVGAIVGQFSDWISQKVELFQRQGEERGESLQRFDLIVCEIKLHDCWEARKASNRSIGEPGWKNGYLFDEMSKPTSSHSGKPSIVVSSFSLRMSISILLAFSIVFFVSLLISVRLRFDRSSS